MRTFPLKGRKTTILDRNQPEKKTSRFKIRPVNYHWFKN